jgi:hypothetical protein
VPALVAIAWLVRYYLSAPEHHDLRLVFGMPAILLYVQAGYLFAKKIVVAWRTPVPQINAEEHLEAREATRKLYIKICDLNRAVVAVTFLFWPVMLSASPASRIRFAILSLAGWVAITIAAGVWQEITRKRLLKITLRARPVRLPDFMESNAPSWPLLCYQPSAPMLVLKGARGYSLNLANTMAYLGAAYLGGWALLFVVLRTWH